MLEFTYKIFEEKSKTYAQSTSRHLVYPSVPLSGAGEGVRSTRASVRSTGPSSTGLTHTVSDLYAPDTQRDKWIER